MKIFKTSEYSIDATGEKDVTKELQQLINRVSEEQGKLVLEKGTYLTSSLFLRSNMELHFEDGARILASTDDSAYPMVRTRVAGIEMPWYPGLLNCSGEKHVVVSGNGIIDGQGEYWWAKYWGHDRKSGLRGEYEPYGLRWASDYDAVRLRNVVVSNSEDVTLKDFTSYKSGFWNIHVFYSGNIHIDGVKVLCGSINGPSTDGIDIDSCHDVLIENCETHTHDDSICIKSGRDADGLRVNIPCSRVEVRNCRIYEGYGVTLGSEVSGGIEDIILKNIQFFGTDCGFRIKSAYSRKGYIRRITAEDLYMENVRFCVHIQLNWNANYNVCTVGENYTGEIPENWKLLMEPVPEKIPPTKVEDLRISRVRAVRTGEAVSLSQAFVIDGYADQSIRGLSLEDMDIVCNEYGMIRNIERLRMDQVFITVTGGSQEKWDTYDNT